MNLTREETLVFRALKRTAVVLMLVRYLDKPVGEGDIAAILDIDPKTARAHLRSLAALGLLTRLQFHRGYQLTHAGRQMALPMAAVENHPDPALLPAMDPGEIFDMEPPEEPRGGDLPLGEVGDPDPTCEAQGTPSGEDRSSLVGPSEPGSPSPHDPGDFPGSLNINIKDKESMNESIKNNNNYHPGKTPGSAELPLEKHPEHKLVARFLGEHGIYINDRTRRLLGKITCDDILSVANSLESQGMLNETGLFVVLLEQRVAQGLANWEEVYGTPSMQPVTPDACWQPDEIEYSQPEEVQNQEDLIDFTGPPEIETAWYAAVEQARGEIPPAAFDTWLVPARPLAWDPEEEALTVGVANSYARGWLDEHVKNLLAQNLAGILKTRAVSVEFVVTKDYRKD